MPDTIAEIRERLAAATPGPWSPNDHLADEGCIYIESPSDGIATVFDGPIANADFIAHAPTDIACLLELLDDIAPHLETAAEACLLAPGFIKKPAMDYAAARAALAHLKEQL